MTVRLSRPPIGYEGRIISVLIGFGSEGSAPKLAVLMIGTNNHSSSPPEVTARDIRLIVKKLRRKLPETKVLVLAIFPRGGGDDDGARQKNMKVNKLIADNIPADLPREFTDQKPYYQAWDEEVPTGQIAVAMDGSVLIFKGHGARSEDPKFIAVKRSEDGGKTWSEEKKIGETGTPLAGISM